jgi:anti-sigma B factor antagonist
VNEFDRGTEPVHDRQTQNFSAWESSANWSEQWRAGCLPYGWHIQSPRFAAGQGNATGTVNSASWPRRGAILSRRVSPLQNRMHFKHPKAPMKIELEKVDDNAVIKLSGRLDMNTSPDFRKAALTLYTKGQCRALTIDFANVSYIDTSGLATLVEILVTAKARSAHLALSGVNEKVRYLIDVNGLAEVFRIEGSSPQKLGA